ncbi:MAG: lysophospholipid acyltransferase family protein [Bacteroidales bacterium]|nr:lysophospholipid acyltransferase family protein [Bacteroidales bacterium]
MERISYYIFLFFTRLFAIIPFWALYCFSNMFYFLFYYIIPYRKKIIWQNISRSFPDLDQKEQTKIIKGFYRNLCDLLVEWVKGQTLSNKALLKRYVFVNPEVLNDLYSNGQDVVCVGSHYANWEWGIMAAPLQLKHKLIAFYTPMTNKPIDFYIRQNRKKLGSELIAKEDVRKVFNAKYDKPAAYFFGADQSPSNPKGSHWMKFLNQDTPCMKGPEFFARRYHLPVVYFDIQRLRRGYYTAKLKVIEYDPVNTVAGEITENYMHTLEQLIIKKPEDYLWSHRRWKHSRDKEK